MALILAALEAPGLPYHNSTCRGQRIFLSQLQVAACRRSVLSVLPPGNVQRGPGQSRRISFLTDPACSIDFGGVAPVSIMMLSSSVADAVRAPPVLPLDPFLRFPSPRVHPCSTAAPASPRWRPGPLPAPAVHVQREGWRCPRGQPLTND